MAVVFGHEAKLYRNTGSYGAPSLNEVPNVSDLTLTLESDDVDATTRGNGGWKASEPGLKNLSIEFNMVWNPGDADFEAVRDAWLNNTSIEFFVLDGESSTGGVQGPRATCKVFSFTREEPVGDVLKVSVSLKPSFADNAPSWYTV